MDVARVSSIIVWGILGVGLLLGAWWAYTILGWGGYWGWDPIENVAFMPWLVLTAFIHSIMAQKRRGMFRMWNVALLNIAFVLAQLGMFINRGGPVVSVHSFAASTLGAIFLSFMIICLIFGFSVFIWRLPSLRSDRPMESFLSREASFLVNNFLLLGVTFATLWGVVFPVLAEFAQGKEISVAAPYFNQVNGPLLLTVLFVMGIGPLLPWRRTAGRSLARHIAIPSLAGLAVVAGMIVSGITSVIAVIAFGVIAFTAVTVLEEWYLGARSRHRSGENWPLAWWRLVNGNRPRHGGYIVHLALLTLSLGVVGTQFFDQRTDIVLRPGESAVIDDYRIEYTGRNSAPPFGPGCTVGRPEHLPGRRKPIRRRSGWIPNRAAKVRGWLPGRRADRRATALARVLHRLQPGFSQGGHSVHLAEDLYVIPSDFLSEDRVLLRISINPLAMWLWIAGPIFVIGTIFALWPQPALERRPPRPAAQSMATRSD